MAENLGQMLAEMKIQNKVVSNYKLHYDPKQMETIVEDPNHEVYSKSKQGDQLMHAKRQRFLEITSTYTN